MNRYFKKISLALAAITMLGSTSAVTVVNAATVSGSDESTNVVSAGDFNKLSDIQLLKLVGGFDDSDLAQLSVSDISSLGSEVRAEINDPYKTEIGYTSIAKAIVKVWKKIPSGVKKSILKHTTLSGLLKAIDHFTGTEKHIIYSALRYCHVPAKTAKLATKIITLFI